MPLNEGQTVQYTVTTTNTADGTVLYWKTTGNTTNSDIVGGNTGSISIVNNRAVFNVTVLADESLDGTKTLGIALSTGSQSGPTVVTTASPITVDDTSNSPAVYLYAWGVNDQGQLGLSNRTYRSSPVQVGTDANWSKISVNEFNSIGLKSDGTLWTWGANFSGQLGLNDTNNRSSPTQIGTDTNWSDVCQGKAYSMAIRTNNTLWLWGSGSYGVLGNNNTTEKSSPTQLGSLSNWSKLPEQHCNNFWHAIKTDGTLWACGREIFGTLGNGSVAFSNENKSSPVQVGSDTNWNKVFGTDKGFATHAIKTNGTLWGWGNRSSVIGLNGAGGNYILVPTQVGSLTTWDRVACGYLHTLMLRTDGRLFATGADSSGSLGLNTLDVYKSSPTQVGSGTDWRDIGAYYTGSAAIKTDGTLWTWGNNGSGQLGRNNTVLTSSPVQVGSATNWLKVVCAYKHTLATKSS
jgi:alpha-tubulin suppressor-like RCC1 family protein